MCKAMHFLMLFIYLALFSANVHGDWTGITTRYWDCCKVSCSWSSNIGGGFTAPVQACAKDGLTFQRESEQSSCTNGNAYVCNHNGPFVIDNNLSYGFAATSIVGKSMADTCCACYLLKFTSSTVDGKQMVVQSTDTGALQENHIDIAIPGGGVGEFTLGCQKQWNAPPEGWGLRYGGIAKESECNQLPAVLQAGCHWRFNWFKDADNPDINFKRVRCPKQITDISSCIRDDDINYPDAPGMSVVTTPEPPSESCSESREWEQCGGDGWNGQTCCPIGFTCQPENQWYHQCRDDPNDSCDIGRRGEQCGGKEYTGETCCPIGFSCQFDNEWWSQCDRD